MIIAKSPLRISLFGGGTDFPNYFERWGGLVLSMAIDKYVYVIMNNRFEEDVRVSYTKTEIVDCVNDIEHGIVKECLLWGNIRNQIEVVTMADVPGRGTGLGSSSSLTAALLVAVSTYNGWDPMGPLAIANTACIIERNRLKAPIGKQDQFITAWGGVRSITFNKNGHIYVNYLPQNRELENNLLLFHTGKARQATHILENMSRKPNLAALQVSKDLASEAIKQYHNADLVGSLLSEYWEAKKSFSSGISNPDIDRMYDRAIEAGALGAKICGAGGGGFLLVYCHDHEQMRQALSEYKELPFNISGKGTHYELF